MERKSNRKPRGEAISHFRADQRIEREAERVKETKPVKLQPGQTVRVRIKQDNEWTVRTYTVVRQYKYHYQMQTKLGMNECFTMHDLQKRMVK